jgi:hypothetical protein
MPFGGIIGIVLNFWEFSAKNGPGILKLKFFSLGWIPS